MTTAERLIREAVRRKFAQLEVDPSVRRRRWGHRPLLVARDALVKETPVRVQRAVTALAKARQTVHTLEQVIREAGYDAPSNNRVALRLQRRYDLIERDEVLIRKDRVAKRNLIETMSATATAAVLGRSNAEAAPIVQTFLAQLAQV